LQSVGAAHEVSIVAGDLELFLEIEGEPLQSPALGLGVLARLDRAGTG